MRTAHCSICGQRIDARNSASMPFCSERCRYVDLGRWLNEDYGLPVELDESEDVGYRPDERDD